MSVFDIIDDNLSCYLYDTCVINENVNAPLTNMRICVVFLAALPTGLCKIECAGTRRRRLRQCLFTPSIRWRGRLQFKAAILCMVPPALDYLSRVRFTNQHR